MPRTEPITFLTEAVADSASAKSLCESPCAGSLGRGFARTKAQGDFVGDWAVDAGGWAFGVNRIQQSRVLASGEIADGPRGRVIPLRSLEVVHQLVVWPTCGCADRQNPARNLLCSHFPFPGRLLPFRFDPGMVRLRWIACT
jgi:hypothetical protein